MADKWAYLPVLLVTLVGLLAIAGITQESDEALTGLAMGRYAQDAKEHLPMLSIRPECQETDRGYDWYIAGTTWYDTAGFKKNTDWCQRKLVLHEYFCYRGRIRDRRVLCPAGYSCNEGACTPDTNTYYLTKASDYYERIQQTENVTRTRQ